MRSMPPAGGVGIKLLALMGDRADLPMAAGAEEAGQKTFEGGFRRRTAIETKWDDGNGGR